jgi:hypothetical protein
LLPYSFAFLDQFLDTLPMNCLYYQATLVATVVAFAEASSGHPDTAPTKYVYAEENNVSEVKNL